MLPPPYHLRPYRDGDATLVAALANEEARALARAGTIDAEWLRLRWTAPTVDVEHDLAVVTTAAGEVCGAVFVHAPPPHTAVRLEGFVALDHHGRGIGTALIDEGARRARRLGALAPSGERVVLQPGTLVGVPRVEELMRAHRFAPVRTFWEMTVRFDGPRVAPVPVPGVVIGTVGTGEERAVYDCLTAAFDDHWGPAEPDFATWVARETGAAGFDPALWFCAWAGAELAGALTAIAAFGDDPETGYVAELGVRPAFRGRGIARALLDTALATFAQRGLTGARLHVDAGNETGATRLYEAVGMTAEPAFMFWEKELER
jgi:ribosomal protein S18 acetylase RimI-like enzyme